VVGESFAIWAAQDGLWYYGIDGYRNLVGECLKKEQWEALVPSTIAGYRLEIAGRFLYIGFYDDGALKGFVVDPSNPNGIYFLDTGYASGYWDPLQRKLFVLDGTVLKQWDASSSFMTATFRGRVDRQLATTEAEWIDLLSTGNVAVKVFTENPLMPEAALVQRYNRTITSGLNRLSDGVAGRDWQVEVSTTGSVQALGIE
jgi:hypothetical protein